MAREISIANAHFCHQITILNKSKECHRFILSNTITNSAETLGTFGNIVQFQLMLSWVIFSATYDEVQEKVEIALENSDIDEEFRRRANKKTRHERHKKDQDSDDSDAGEISKEDFPKPPAGDDLDHFSIHYTLNIQFGADRE
ncbi:hypothetical protein QAD02_020977 [Eretmocerus hayati]|uniref:Uncharacterized protein n=1 Tax=Eretmocerus hayati TaxID=131215 RepID=A0ACC2PPF7_9HYME|nr:hypothetical protein QAD02_020977 [Eretmocerus hayati]